MNKRLASIGIAKQSAKGSAATAASYWCGVTQGSKLIPVTISDKADDASTGLRAASAAYRESVAMAGDFGIRAWPKIMGLLLYGVLGSKTVSGSSGSYTHVFTLGDTVPYFTLWAQYFGTAEYRQLIDCKIDELKISFDAGKPIDVNVTLAGLSIGYAASTTGYVDETRDPFMTAVGGTFQYDLDGSTLASVPVLGGDLDLKQNVNAQHVCTSVAPYDVDEGAFEGSVSLKTVAADNLAMRTLLTGSPSGTVISEVPIFGSSSLQFVQGAASLTLASARIPFVAGEDAYDAAGGRPELDLTGDMLIPAAGTTPLTATLVNSVASY